MQAYHLSSLFARLKSSMARKGNLEKQGWGRSSRHKNILLRKLVEFITWSTTIMSRIAFQMTHSCLFRTISPQLPTNEKGRARSDSPAFFQRAASPMARAGSPMARASSPMSLAGEAGENMFKSPQQMDTSLCVKEAEVRPRNHTLR